MKKILISGGAGFIGSRLALKLLDKDYEVTILDNFSPQIHGADYKESPLYLSVTSKNIKIFRGDIRNRKDWKQAIAGQQVVVHLAADTGTGQSMYEVKRYTDVNIGGTAELLDILINENQEVQKLIIASSRTIYGEGKCKCEEHGSVYPGNRSEDDMLKGDFSVKCPFCTKSTQPAATDEDAKIQPISIYGITKHVAEQMSAVVCNALKIPFIALRYQNVYGPGQSLSNPYTGILSIFSTRIQNNSTIYIYEDGKESRDFVYIDDAVDATIAGIENESIQSDCFNVGYGSPVTVLEVANMLKTYLKSNVNTVINSNFRIGDIRHNFADLCKIKKLLGYEPKVCPEDGIKIFCQWIEGQNIHNDDYERSINEMKGRGIYR